MIFERSLEETMLQQERQDKNLKEQNVNNDFLSEMYEYIN